MFTKHIIFIASALATHVSGSCLHGTLLLPRVELPGGRVAVSEFGYTGDKGPFNWAGLSAENSACSSSKVQSPINIDDTIGLAKEAPVVKIDNVQNAEFENLGTTIEVIVNGTTTFAGAEFSLKQFHFHTPSEHRIAEEYFPLEMHMVHEAADGSGGIAVIAVTFQLSEDGSTTELLTAVTKNLPEIATPGTVTETGALDFGPLIDHVQTTPLFQYTGSLTTPPCAEGLTFLVTQKPLPLNVATFNAMKSIIKFNSRFTQNILGQANVIELGAGNLGCDINVPDDVVDDILSSTAPADVSTTETPAPTSEVAHPEPVTTTTVEEAPAATEEATTTTVEEAPVATEEATTTTVEEAPVATEEATTSTVEETPVATEHVPELATTSTVEEAPAATTTAFEYPTPAKTEEETVSSPVETERPTSTPRPPTQKKPKNTHLRPLKPVTEEKVRDKSKTLCILGACYPLVRLNKNA